MMANRLTSAEIAALTGEHVAAYPVYEASHTFSGTTTDLTPYLLGVGKIKYVLTNRHPARRRGTVIPIADLRFDNRDGLLTFGNADGLFPDEKTRTKSLLRVVVKIMRPQRTVLDFTGIPSHPVHEDDGVVRVTIEHVTRELSRRIWQRSDQVRFIDSNLLAGKFRFDP